MTETAAAPAATKWADSRTGQLSIALRFNGTTTAPVNMWSVWALYKGTHDLAPVSRHFPEDQKQAARDYANHLWRTR